MTDKYDRWRVALAGGKLDFGDRGDPPHGFFRKRGKDGWEVLAIFEKDGMLCCRRSNPFGKQDKLDGQNDLIDELLAGRVYAIPRAIWDLVVKEKKPLPVEYTTSLTTREEAAGICWTLELARAKLGEVPGESVEEKAAAIKVKQEAEDRKRAEIFKKGVAAEFPGATVVKDLPDGEVGKGAESSPPPIGHNNPPEDLTPPQALMARVKKLSAAVAAWMKGLPDGKITLQPQADTIANYAIKFKELSTEATKDHDAEKKPYLDKGREIDEAWFSVRDEAEKLRTACLDRGLAWKKTEDAKRKADADAATKQAREAAVEAAVISGGPIEDVAAIEPEKVSLGTAKKLTSKKVKTWRVVDRDKFALYLLHMKGFQGIDAPQPELCELLDKLAKRMGAAGSEVLAMGLIAFDEGEKLQ